MKPERVLVFDLSADFGFVRKNYTTMSPLSFPVLTRTAIGGIIGAITGTPREENPEKYFPGSFIAQRLLNPVKKIGIPQNLLKTTSRTHFARFSQHKPTNIEFLKDVKYRIYYQHQDTEYHDLLKKHLVAHTSCYTVSVGVSQALADFRYAGEFDLKERRDDKWVTIHSLIPVDMIADIRFGENELFTATMPNCMKNDREVVEYREFLFDRQGKEVDVKIPSYFQINEKENIVPM